MPYLIQDFQTATVVAMVVVFVELWAMAWVRNRYMETPFWRAALQVVAGGSLVFASGIVIERVTESWDTWRFRQLADRAGPRPT